LAAKAIVAYHTGKRDSSNTDLFIQDLRQRVLGLPGISSDGFKPYLPAIREAFAIEWRTAWSRRPTA
jgi:hypothetical protein